MLVWAYHPKLRPVAVAVVAIAVVVAVEAVDKWESYSWCRASPAFAPTQPLPLSWAVSVLSRGSLLYVTLQFKISQTLQPFLDKQAPEAPSKNVRWKTKSRTEKHMHCAARWTQKPAISD